MHFAKRLEPQILRIGDLELTIIFEIVPFKMVGIYRGLKWAKLYRMDQISYFLSAQNKKLPIKMTGMMGPS